MLPSLLQTKQTVKMLAVLEQWDPTSGSYTDNTHNYFLLLLFKSAMDTAVFCLCGRKQSRALLSACSLSILLADWLLLLSVATVWLFLTPGGSSESLCFVLAHASATFTALPLPMMSLGLLDYCLEDSCVNHRRTFCKLLRNVLLTLLVWALAVTYSFHTVSAKPMQLMEETGMTALGCEVGESSLTTCFVLVLFWALLFAALPFWSRIPQWVIEAERLADVRTENESKKSDLMFTSNHRLETESREENHLEENHLEGNHLEENHLEENHLEEDHLEEKHLEESVGQRPPLWFSLTLGFGLLWMPYLATCVACMLCGIGVPAYISVNLLWLECANSLLVGLVFWMKSETRGPYSRLPENVCLWSVYWHLSRAAQHQQLHVAVFNPSKVRRNSYYYV